MSALVVITQKCTHPMAEHPVRWGLLLYLGAIVIGGAAYSLAEKDANLADGWYWATVVAPTVGFGDYSPETWVGRWLVYQPVWISGKVAELLLLGAFADAIGQAAAIRRLRHAGDDTADLTDDIEHLQARIKGTTDEVLKTLTRLDHLTNDPEVEQALHAAHRRRTQEAGK